MGQEYEDEMRAKRIESERRTLEQDLEHELDQLRRERESLTAQRDKLQRFKSYVHARLDQMGVPTHPNGPHSAEGCRIGDRLDCLFSMIAGAPDLLACCVDELSLYAGMDFDAFAPETARRLKAMRAAVAKATGQAAP